MTTLQEHDLVLIREGFKHGQYGTVAEVSPTCARLTFGHGDTHHWWHFKNLKLVFRPA